MCFPAEINHADIIHSSKVAPTVSSQLKFWRLMTLSCTFPAQAHGQSFLFVFLEGRERQLKKIAPSGPSHFLRGSIFYSVASATFFSCWFRSLFSSACFPTGQWTNQSETMMGTGPIPIPRFCGLKIWVGLILMPRMIISEPDVGHNNDGGAFFLQYKIPSCPK